MNAPTKPLLTGNLAPLVSGNQQDAIAQALVRARRDRAPSDDSQFAIETADEAYAVQRLVFDALQATAAPFPPYWKSGGPAIEKATHAPLPLQGVMHSPANASASHFNMRLVEAEIALRLATDVSPARASQVQLDCAFEFVDAMAVTIEIVDSRWQQNVNAPALLKLADMQSHGALIVGEWRPFERRAWAQQPVSVQIGTRPVFESRGSFLIGDPTWVLPAWVRHLTREGRTIPAGTVVTTGTWCGMLPASAGERVAARFEGIGEVSVHL